MLNEESVVGNQKDALRGEGLRTLLDLRWKVVRLDHEVAELALEGATSRYWLARPGDGSSKAVQAWAMKTALENCLVPCDIYSALDDLDRLVERLIETESIENLAQSNSAFESEESLTQNDITSEFEDMAFHGV